MAEKSESESQDFLQPWKFSDAVLVVEEKRLHVHRAVLAMFSPVFEKMFTSEFQEKDKNEVPLPGKKLSEVQELLLMIYPSVADREEKQITEENCYFLVKLAHEYQIDAIVQRCEDFIVNKVKTKPAKDGALAELMFAQTYKLEELGRASVEQAYNLSLEELKKDELYDQIKAEDLKNIMEGIITRLQKELSGVEAELGQSQKLCNEREWKISSLQSQCSSALREVNEIARRLVAHSLAKRARYRDVKFYPKDINSCLAALQMDVGCDYCECGNAKCESLSRVSTPLESIKASLEEFQKD